MYHIGAHVSGWHHAHGPQPRQTSTTRPSHSALSHAVFPLQRGQLPVFDPSEFGPIPSTSVPITKMREAIATGTPPGGAPCPSDAFCSLTPKGVEATESTRRPLTASSIPIEPQDQGVHGAMGAMSKDALSEKKLTSVFCWSPSFETSTFARARRPFLLSLIHI